MSTALMFRPATIDDIPAIVEMLADDALGAGRERVQNPPAAVYIDAFKAIDGDTNHELVLATLDGGAVGVLQLSFLPGMSRQGSWRAQIESVRVASAARDKGIGRSLIEWAIARAGQRGCQLVQLTSDKSRPEALRFYAKLGFKASHEGLKLELTTP